MNTKEKDIKTLVKVLVVFAAALVLYKVVPLFETNNEIYDDCIAQILMLVLALGAAILTHKLGVLKFKTDGLKEGCTVGAVFIFYGGVAIVLWVYNLISGKTDIGVSLFEVITFIVFVILIGISEELIYRGVLLEGFLDYFGNKSVNALRKSIIIGGICFGLIHLMNLFSGYPVKAVFIQAVNAACSGIVFCCIYVKGKRNLYPCIIAHTLLDGGSYVLHGYIASKVITDSNIVVGVGSTSFTGLILGAFYLAIAYFELKEEKLLPYVDNQSSK